MNSSLKNNPLFYFRELPKFEIITPKHAEEAIPVLLEDATRKFKVLEESGLSTWEELFTTLMDLEEPVDYAWGIVTHFMSVMNSDEWRKVHEKLQPLIVNFSLMCGQSKPLYEMMLKIKDSDDFNSLSSAKKRVLESSLRGATFSGVGLEGEDKAEFSSMQKQLSSLSTSFSNNLIDATKSYSLLLESHEDITGLPHSLLESTSSAAKEDGYKRANAENGPWKITLDGPCFISFMKFSSRRDLREKLYRAYVTKASSGQSDNRENIIKILNLRKRKSELLGFKSYAEQSIVSKMAPSIVAVEKLLEKLRIASFNYAVEEIETLKEFLNNSNGDDILNWDLAYWSEKQKKALFDYDEEDLRPYFQFDIVLKGIFKLVNKIFDVEIERSDGSVSVWHEDVSYFIVKKGDERIASFFLDPYVRSGQKRDGAWMNSLWGLDLKKGNLPVAYIVCNQSRATETKPSLMTFSDVNTLFHEFGHALQHMLTIVDVPLAAGINNVEWDAVELASQFMENWCYQKDVLMGISCHYKSKERLPEELFDKIILSKNYMSASAMLRQLYFGILDMQLHDSSVSSYDDVLKIKNLVSKDTTVIKPIEEDRFLCSFAHIFAGGYAAGYFSYKWAEVLSADAFAAFEDSGLDDENIKRVGLQFRDTVLALGGSLPPMDVFVKFRGREPDIKALLRHSGLVQEES